MAKTQKWQSFRGKIVNSDNAYQLALLVQREYVQKRATLTEPSDLALFKVDYTVKYGDGEDFGESPEIFESSKLTRKVKKIEIYLREMVGNMKILVSIKEGRSIYVEVSGDSATWVSGVLKEIEILIESFSEHSPIQMLVRGNFSFITNLLLFMLISLSFPKLLTFVSRWTFLPPISLSSFWLYVICFVISTVILVPFDFLFPSVEIQMGPSNKYIYAKARKIVYWVISVIILPLIISALYDLIK